MSIEAKITEPKMPGIKGALRMARISIPMGGPALQGTDPLLMAEGYELAARMLRNGWAPGYTQAWGNGRGTKRTYTFVIELYQLANP